MTPAGLLLFAILLVAIVVFMSEKLRPDVVAILVMLSLGLTGLVTPRQVFSGFSSSAVILIIAVSILTGGLFRAGVSAVIGRWLVRAAGESELRMSVLVMGVATGLSLFMNNIASAAVIMPAVMDASRRTRISPSKLLLPMALATQLGGMATLFTTASIVASAVLQTDGLRGLGVFDFAGVGGVAALLGLLYMIFIGRRALPDRAPAGDLAQQHQARVDLVAAYELPGRLHAIHLEPGSPLIGQSLAQTGIGSQLGLTVLAIERGGRSLKAPSAGETVQDGDVLLMGGNPERAAALASLGVRISPAVDREMLAAADTVLVEVLVAPRARVIGQTLRQVDFRSKYGLSVVAMWHGGRLHRTGVGDLPLRGSETLLVYGPRERLAVLQTDADWVVLATADAHVLRPAKMRLALAILAVSLVAAVASSWPTAAVLFLGALAMVLTGCLTMDEAYQAIEWRSVFLVGSMLPVGLAFSATGAARLLGDAITHSLGAGGPLAVVAGLFLATAALNQFIPGGSAVPAVLVPIGIAAAQGMGSNPRAFALVIAVATGTSMLTPFAHPVNVMVMGPGGYTFWDYVRAGLPLVITTLVAVLVTLPLFWGVR